MAKMLNMDAIKYVLKFERDAPEEEQTKFYIRALKWKERADVQDGIIVTEINMTGPKNQSGRGTMRHLSGTQARIAVEKGLVRAENLRAQDGSIVKYGEDTDAAKKETILDMMPPEWSKELAEEILKMSGLLKEEEKN